MNFSLAAADENTRTPVLKQSEEFWNLNKDQIFEKVRAAVSLLQCCYDADLPRLTQWQSHLCQECCLLNNICSSYWFSFTKILRSLKSKQYLDYLLVSLYFLVFTNKLTILTSNKCKKYPPSILTTSSLTTKPVPFIINKISSKILLHALSEEIGFANQNA